MEGVSVGCVGKGLWCRGECGTVWCVGEGVEGGVWFGGEIII